MPTAGLFDVLEQLLAEELAHLRRYNRFLERNANHALAPEVARFRDGQLARIAALQTHLHVVSDAEEAEAAGACSKSGG